jgi:hypothetical protein
LFSLEESNLSMGFSYGSVFDITKNTPTLSDDITQALGINLTMYGFWDKKNYGMFLSYGGLFNIGKPRNDAIKTYQSAAMDMILGGGFRKAFSDKATLQYGVGFDVTMTGTDYRLYSSDTDYSMLSIDLGLGGNAQVKLDITPSLCLVVGANVTRGLVNENVL